MAVQTVVAPRQSIKLIVAFIACAALGIWGWYDFSVTVPQRARDAEAYSSLRDQFTTFEELQAKSAITDAQRQEWAGVQKRLEAFGDTVPQPPAKWDRPVQFWLYVVGCGLISAPWCLWALWSLARRRYRLEDDGTLNSPLGVWAPDDIVDIDMSRWMDKSIATVHHRDGRTLRLDDYKYKNMHLIVGHLAHRFHPDGWTTEAKIVKNDVAATDDDRTDGFQDDPPSGMDADDTARVAGAR